MKFSKIKFVLLFVPSATIFMTVSTCLFGQPTESIFGTGSFLSIILSPIKIILIGPLLPFIHFLRQDPDTPPPFYLAGFALYWTMLALGIHYLVSKFSVRHA
jgi:hypothetical protein